MSVGLRLCCCFVSDIHPYSRLSPGICVGFSHYSTGPQIDPGLQIDLLGLIRFFADFSNFRRDFITIDVPHSVRPFACDLGRSFCHH